MIAEGKGKNPALRSPTDVSLPFPVRNTRLSKLKGHSGFEAKRQRNILNSHVK